MKFREEKIKPGQYNSHPVDTEHGFWLNSEVTLADIMKEVKERFGHSDLSKIKVHAVHHHEYCITYDLHDPSDYTDYIYIERIQ